MASPIWESVGIDIQSGDVDQITVPKPSGVVAGDILIAVLDRASNSTTMSPPSGFTNIQTLATSGGRYNAFWKLAGGSEPADYTFTWTTADTKAVGTIHRISGADGAVPIAGEDDALAENSNPAPPSVNPGSSQDYLSLVTSAIEGKRTHTPPTSYTERNDSATTGGGSPTGHCTVSVATRAYTGQTETPGTFSASASDNWIAGTIIIQPTQGFKVTITEAVGVTDEVKVAGLGEFSTARPAYWKFGVWRNSVGDVYTATAQVGSDQHRRLTVWKSEDDGASWADLYTFVPSGTSFTNSGQPFEMCIGLLDDDILHIFWNPDEDTDDKQLQYCAWDTSDDTLEFAPEIAYAVGVTGRTVGSSDVSIRSTGELVVAFREDPTDGSGEISMIRGTQGSWTSHTDISTGDGISAGDFGIATAVASNNDVHVVWQDSPIIHRVLRANNTLSTIDTGNASATTLISQPGFAEIFDGKLFYTRLASDGSFKPVIADGTVAEDITFTNRFLDADVPDRGTGVMGVTMAQAGGRLIMGWVQEDTQEAVWLEYDPSSDAWGTTPQGTGVTVAEGADVIFDAWVRGGNVYAVLLENPDSTVDNNMPRRITEDLVGTEVTAQDFTRSVSEAVGVTDSTTRIVPFERADAEAVGAADSVLVATTFSRPTDDEAIGVTDSTAFAITKQRSSDEAVGVTDLVARVHLAERIIDETVGVTDEVTTAKAIDDAIDETVGVADSTTLILEAKRTIDEGVGVTDAATPVKAIAVQIDESVGITDGVTRVAPANRIIDESVGVADSTTRIHNAERIIDETVGVSDSITRIAPAVRSVDESVGVTDSIATKLVIAVEVDEAVGITDAVSRVAPAVREISEPAGVTDDVAPAKTIQVGIDESVGVADSTIDDLTVGGVDVFRTVTEPVGITDAVAAAKTIRVTIDESVDVADSTSPAKAAAATVTEAMGVVDSVSRVHDAIRGVDEAVGITDQATADKVINVIVTELVGAADSTNAAKAMAIAIVEGVGISDDTTGAKTVLASVTEAVGVLDSVSRVVDYAWAVDEGVGVSDLVSTLFIPAAGIPTIRDFTGAQRSTFTGSKSDEFEGKVM